VLDSEIDRVNSALQKWKQGDCTIGEHIFVHQFDPKQPLITTKPYTVIDEESLVKSVVRGFVVLTQTCDLVRDCQDRPYLEISPLIEIETNFLEEVRKMKRPQYAYIPGIAEKNLVADLDRVMTVEKLSWQPGKGYQGVTMIKILPFLVKLCHESVAGLLFLMTLTSLLKNYKRG
jgi:hypothetical protein